MFVYTGRVHGRVHGQSCTWQVGLPGHVHVPRRHATAVCGPSRPCTRPAHSPFTAVYTAVYDGRNTAVRHVHTSTPQLKGRVRAMYTYTSHTQPCTCSSTRAVYTARTRPSTRFDTARTRPCTRPVHSRIHGPCTRAMYTARTRHVHGSVNVRVYGPCTRSRTRPVHSSVYGRVRRP